MKYGKAPENSGPGKVGGPAPMGKEIDIGPITNTGTDYERWVKMLEVGGALFACNPSMIMALTFCHSKSTETYHSDLTHGTNGNTKNIKAYDLALHSGVGKLAARLEAEKLLDATAVVYTSEGHYHEVGGKFDTGHPEGSMPLHIFGSMGGAFKTKGDIALSGTIQTVWMALGNAMAGRVVDYSSIGGSAYKPASI
jgi:hypothetical protein